MRLLNKIKDLNKSILNSNWARRNPGIADICKFAEKAAEFLIDKDLAVEMKSTEHPHLPRKLSELLVYDFDGFIDETEEYFDGEELGDFEFSTGFDIISEFENYDDS